MTWGVILGAACVFPTVIILYLRTYLKRENTRRDRLQSGGLINEIGVLEHVNKEDGTVAEEVVDARQLDLTDRENLAL